MLRVFLRKLGRFAADIGYLALVLSACARLRTESGHGQAQSGASKHQLRLRLQAIAVSRTCRPALAKPSQRIRRRPSLRVQVPDTVPIGIVLDAGRREQRC